jgi:hypothetical protein
VEEARPNCQHQPCAHEALRTIYEAWGGTERLAVSWIVEKAQVLVLRVSYHDVL